MRRINGTQGVYFTLERLSVLPVRVLHHTAVVILELLLYLIYRTPFEPTEFLRKSTCTTILLDTCMPTFLSVHRNTLSDLLKLRVVPESYGTMTVVVKVYLVMCLCYMYVSLLRVFATD